MMIHVARQAIFDTQMNVYGYELLYRENAVRNSFENTEADEASSKVIVNSFVGIGIERLTDGKRAFINFTDNLLLEEVATLFPPSVLVIEILETVDPDSDIVEKCTKLKELGYQLALDDFIFDPAYEPLLDIVDIIKVEFDYLSLKSTAEWMKKYRGRVRFLAEKIETRQDYETAKKLGFSYFQGYFFAKPVIVSSQNIQPLAVNHMLLMREINQTPYNIQSLTRIISQDISLTYKVLRLVNSVAFGFRSRIQTVQHALVALGEVEVRKWVTLIAMMGMSSEQPEEIIHISLIRAKLAEALAVPFRMEDQASALFLMGLFSLIDVIMGYPMQQLLEEVTLSPAGREALLHQTGPFAPILAIMLAHEQGQWEELAVLCHNLRVTPDIVATCYLEAVVWADSIFALHIGDEQTSPRDLET